MNAALLRPWLLAFTPVVFEFKLISYSFMRWAGRDLASGQSEGQHSTGDHGDVVVTFIRLCF